MKNVALASRYASALISIATELDLLEKVRSEIKEIGIAYRGSDVLWSFLKHPLVSKEDKKKVINELLHNRVCEETRNFLLVLVDKGRLELLPEIAIVFEKLADLFGGICRVKVKTYLPISEKQEKALHEKMRRVFGKKVLLEIEQDSSIMGGLAIFIGDKVIDGSVKYRLKKLREKLLTTKVF